MALDRSLDMIREFEEISGTAPIEVEARAEQASSLGKQGRDMERVLAALAACAAEDPAREELLWAASEAVWYYFVQREACGLRNHRQAVTHYAIPGEVLTRLGARPNR